MGGNGIICEGRKNDSRTLVGKKKQLKYLFPILGKKSLPHLRQKGEEFGVS